jgi:hypothetical protein
VNGYRTDGSDSPGTRGLDHETLDSTDAMGQSD